MFDTAHVILSVCLDTSCMESTEDSETEEKMSFWRYEILYLDLEI